MKHEHETIEPVVRHHLCTGCGVCAGICPRDALEMTIDERRGCYVPRIDTERCTRCGLCCEVCPGGEVDFTGFSAALFGDVPEDVALGSYLGSYIGHAIDDEIRFNSASGGLVTSLLLFALEEGLIDGALVTRMRRDNPLRPEAFIARTKGQIISAAGSKYCPVPAGVALKEILASEGRYAVVGLPCHIQGLRKAERRLDLLRRRIRYRISIACSLDYSFTGTERSLAGLGIAPEQVEVLQYRGRGWPGSVFVRTRDGQETTVAYPDFYKTLGPYSLRRCTLCSDMMGELSDLSCGDAWVPEVMKTDKTGTSFVISRTPEAEELLENAASRGAVELSDLGLGDLLASQGHALFKKRKLTARMRLFRLCGQRVPSYRQKLLPPVPSDYVNMIKVYVARYILSGNHRVLRKLLGALRHSPREATKTAVPPRAPVHQS
ncbi:MAG: Coenzyme F420 hydrogenase/dehydrogenase, beta subunit C-terminal domain [Sedimentisphaerales bacterium]|nr:Coenzyme F420 hydrogenase/dehydrogenase, beta subunit C-terminal domain [Sedimentisphaerales bacterium]